MRKTAILILCLCLCIGLCGCDMWMKGSYAHVSPHKIQDTSGNGERIEVSSYETLYQALCNIVENGTAGATIYYPTENAVTVHSYMENAVKQVRADNPMGSYAVEKITYEVGTKGGVLAVAVQVRYNRSFSDIRYMYRVTEMQEGTALVYDALEKCRPSATFYVENYSQMDFAQLIKNYVDANPDVCMEMPQVTVTNYPQNGDHRVIEVLFAYENSRDDLRAMQQTVATSFDSAMLSVTQSAGTEEKCAQLYRYLVLHYDPDGLYTSITPAYSLLHYNIGDSKAYATVYAAMCNKVGLECSVVVGAKDGKPHYWNAVKEGETYRFVDFLQCARQGAFAMQTKEQMKNYVWDYSAFGG